MKTNKIHFTKENERYLLYNERFSGNDNNEKRKRMKLYLLNVMESDLTPMQKFCISEHIMKGRAQKEIARQLGLNNSTICRHIAAGKKKLKKAAEFLDAGG